MADVWAELWQQFDGLAAQIARSKAINVNSRALRQAARDVVQLYFRSVRPEFAALRLSGDSVAALDKNFQNLLRLSNGLNARRSYQSVTRQLNRERSVVEAEREIAIGTRSASDSTGLGELSRTELAILATLGRMIPSAALSYEQALIDLTSSGRVSYRGIAAELRECFREVLDHLAPDKEVMKADWFTLDEGQSKPTMRQKTRFILQSRGLSKSARSLPEASVQRIEDSAGVLARSVYQRSSLQTHTATSKAEIQQLKLYVDGMLAELLQIHSQS